MELKELRTYLKRVDEIQLMELLEVSTEDLLERFEDRLIDKQDVLEAWVEEEHGITPLDFDDRSVSDSD